VIWQIYIIVFVLYVQAMAYIFIDGRSKERRLHAERCYVAFQKRAVALYAWLDVVCVDIRLF